jgi:hypothetical protein
MFSTPFTLYSTNNLAPYLCPISMTSYTFWNGPGNFGGDSRALALLEQSNYVTALFSSRHPIRGTGRQ